MCPRCYLFYHLSHTAIASMTPLLILLHENQMYSHVSNLLESLEIYYIYKLFHKVFTLINLAKRNKGRTIIFLDGGGGMKNIEKNCLQGLKRQNKLFANIICIKKIGCIEVRETFLIF